MIEKFQLRYDFEENNKTARLDEHKNPFYYIKHEISGFELMCIIKEFMNTRNKCKRAFAERLLKIISVATNRSREDLLKSLPNFNMR